MMKLNANPGFGFHLVTLLVAAFCVSASANNVAWWRFEEGPADANVSHGGLADGQFYAGVADSSGNGNALSVWAENWAGYAYRSDRPYSNVPRTGASNNFSVQNTGSLPAMFTSSTAAMRTMTPLAWTIEVAFKPESGNYRTLIGRDSRGSATTNGDLAALYLQIQPDNSLAIKYCDVAGYWHEAISAAGLITGFPFPNSSAGVWYQAAAVCDGTTLSLYLKTIGSYSLVAQTSLAGNPSPNKALTAGTGDGGDWDAGNWSVGRGLYGGGHTDRAFGFIDEVRISDSALAVSQFLGSSDSEPDDVILTPVAGSNNLSIRIAAQGSVSGPLGNVNINTSDTKTASLAGTQPLMLESLYDANTYGGTATGLNFHNGDVQVTNNPSWNLDLGYAYIFIYLGYVTVDSQNLHARLKTPIPPAAISGGTSFPLAQHDLILDGGTLTITPHGYVADQNIMTSSTIDLATSPLQGPVNSGGNGTVTLSQPVINGTDATYTVTVTMPANLSQVLSTNPVTQTLTITGTTVWQGSFTRTIELPVENYDSWAADHAITGGPDASGPDGIPNLLLYALDLKLDGTNGSPGVLTGNLLSFTKRPDAVTNGDVTYAIEESDDLGLTDPWAEVAAYVTNNATTISCTLPSGKIKTFARLVVRQAGP